MTYKDLKNYVVLSNGNQINQTYTPVKESDIIQQGKKLYFVFDDDIIVDGKLLKFKNKAQIIYTCQKEDTMSRHLKEFRDAATIYWDALKQCICRVNAYCEYYIHKEEQLYKEHNKPVPDTATKWYTSVHHGLENLKSEMSHQLIWRENKINYFGQGGALKEQSWYDTPLGLHKDKIYW